MSKFWKHEHPYYMSEGCFFAGGQMQHYETWKEYLDDWKDSEADLNLLWRWDFIWDEDEPAKNPRLDIFYIIQRKGYTFSCHIKEVTEKDLPAIEKFFKKKAKKMAEIWNPFLAVKP